MTELNERTEQFLLATNREKVILLLRHQRKQYVNEKAGITISLSENLERNKVIIPRMQERLALIEKEIKSIDEDLKRLEVTENVRKKEKR